MPSREKKRPSVTPGSSSGIGLAAGSSSRRLAGERVEQREVGLGGDRVVARHLELHLDAGQRAQLGEQLLGAEPRQQAAVELERDRDRGSR